MAKELKVEVKAEGARDAEQDLNAVAAAENNVANAAGVAGDASRREKEAAKENAEAKKQLDDKNRTLAERLRALGPEFALLGDAVDSATLKEGRMATVVGLVGVAILGATMLVRKYNQVKEEQARKIQQAVELTLRQAQAYTDLEASIEKARLAEQKRFAGTAGASAEQAIGRVLQRGSGVGLGKPGVEAAAESLVAGGPFESDAQEKAFYLWMSLGYAADVGDPRERRMRFASAWRRDGNLAARLERELAAHKQSAPMAFSRSRRQEQLLAQGYTPAGRGRALLAGIAEAESARRGTEVTGEELLDELYRGIALARVSQGRETRNRRELAREAEALIDPLLDRYPELLEQVPLVIDPQRGFAGDNPTYRIPRAGQERFAGTLGGALRDARVGVRPDAGGGVTVIVGDSYQGGTHVHQQDKRDPAGQPSRQTR